MIVDIIEFDVETLFLVRDDYVIAGIKEFLAETPHGVVTWEPAQGEWGESIIRGVMRVT